MMEKTARIFIAGHRGMVGSAIVRALMARGYDKLIVRTSKELDLRDHACVAAFFAEVKPEYVFLAAAKVGGIVANNTYRAEFLYDNLMIEANVIVRGLRVFSDFEFEFRMGLANQRLASDIETVAFITAEEHTFLSSSTVKEIASLHGNVSSMVPPHVEKALKIKVNDMGDGHSPPNALRD